MKAVFLLAVLLMLSVSVMARHISGQVTEVVDYKNIKIIDTAGSRQQIQLAGLADLPPGHVLQHQAKNRLVSLIAGKFIEIELVDRLPGSSQSAAVSYGGLDISARLLQEGLGLTTDDSLATLPEQLQRRYLLAEDQARQQARGLWSKNRASQTKRFYQPSWVEPGIPTPWQRAPVFTPAR